MYRIGPEEIDALRRVIESKQMRRAGDPADGHQGMVDRFEREWSAKIGVRHTLCLSGGGTASLVSALVGLEIGPGDEVLVPAYTWMATAVAVLIAGAIPVLVDVNATLAMDPKDVRTKLTEHTKAIIPVHMAGRPADLESLLAIAREHGLRLIEDCCQDDGGSYRGKRVGSWGDAGAYSFNDFKLMSCGEGGALVTSDRRVYERALIYSDLGASFRRWASDVQEPLFLGQQLRASELMGAVLWVQSQRVDGIIADLKRVRNTFESELCGVSGIEMTPSNDPDGDCGVVIAFRFDDEPSARRFATSAGVEGWLPIDSEKHVYTNWLPIWAKRVGHVDRMNPYNHPMNAGLGREYSAGICQKTLDHLSRNVFISLNPDWSEEEIFRRIQACRTAARTS